MIIESYTQYNIKDDYNYAEAVNKFNRGRYNMMKSYVKNEDYGNGKSQQTSYYSQQQKQKQKKSVKGKDVVKTLLTIGVVSYLGYKYVYKPISQFVNIVMEIKSNNQKTMPPEQVFNGQVRELTKYESLKLYRDRKGETILRPEEYEVITD